MGACVSKGLSEEDKFFDWKLNRAIEQSDDVVCIKKLIKKLPVLKETVYETCAHACAGNKLHESDPVYHWLFGPEFEDKQANMSERGKMAREALRHPILESGVYPKYGHVFTLAHSPGNPDKLVKIVESPNLLLRTNMVAKFSDAQRDGKHYLPAACAVVQIYPKGYKPAPWWWPVWTATGSHGPSTENWKEYTPKIWQKFDKATDRLRSNFEERQRVTEHRLKKEMFRMFDGKPYMHVELVCVDPAAQGRGDCSKLMRAINRVADMMRLPIFLGAGGDRNRAIFAHFGYRITTEGEYWGKGKLGSFELLDANEVWPLYEPFYLMKREPDSGGYERLGKDAHIVDDALVAHGLQGLDGYDFSKKIEGEDSEEEETSSDDDKGSKTGSKQGADNARQTEQVPGAMPIEDEEHDDDAQAALDAQAEEHHAVQQQLHLQHIESQAVLQEQLRKQQEEMKKMQDALLAQSAMMRSSQAQPAAPAAPAPVIVPEPVAPAPAPAPAVAAAQIAAMELQTAAALEQQAAVAPTTQAAVADLQAAAALEQQAAAILQQAAPPVAEAPKPVDFTAQIPADVPAQVIAAPAPAVAPVIAAPAPVVAPAATEQQWTAEEHAAWEAEQAAWHAQPATEQQWTAEEHAAWEAEQAAWHAPAEAPAVEQPAPAAATPAPAIAQPEEAAAVAPAGEEQWSAEEHAAWEAQQNAAWHGADWNESDWHGDWHEGGDNWNVPGAVNN